MFIYCQHFLLRHPLFSHLQSDLQHPYSFNILLSYGITSKVVLLIYKHFKCESLSSLSTNLMCHFLFCIGFVSISSKLKAALQKNIIFYGYPL